MVDVLRKHVAPQYRILVDAKAFLNTTINDAVLFFTASQIELMRNLVDYANRRTTFVSDYYIGYYLSPDDTDWNLIQGIVADLEGKLMGNNNVIWGYESVYVEAKYNGALPAGDPFLYGATVPEGEVWRLSGAGVLVESASCTKIVFRGVVGGKTIWFTDINTPISGFLYRLQIDIILDEGSYLYAQYSDTTLNDAGRLFLWGHKMEVPT